ncbi:dUTP diphosphatase [Candidatus Woesearchaeota archaeon]|nr:dUTP diphosphatase [Candidatus Woesearchaeota archaeon]
MNIRIKRIDKSLPLPEYKTKGAAAFDVYARETMTIKPREVAYIPLNICLAFPPGTCVLLANRSSTHKLGITSINGIGIGDSDFCGDNDEYKFAALNYTDKEVTIERGTRIAQMLIMDYHTVTFEEVDGMKNNDRGGFGSTGLK